MLVPILTRVTCMSTGYVFICHRALLVLFRFALTPAGGAALKNLAGGLDVGRLDHIASLVAPGVALISDHGCNIGI